MKYQARFTKSTDPVLAKAGDDEAIFVLRGQDALACDVISYWIEQASRAGLSAGKLNAARVHLKDMVAWQIAHDDRVKIPD